MKLIDRLYGETDDTCAICGVRGVGILTEHHIDGDSSNNVYDNLIVLCHNAISAIIQTRGLRQNRLSTANGT